MWCGIGLAIERSWVRLPVIPLSCNNSGQVIHAHMSLRQLYADVGQAHLAVQDVIEYQTSALQRVPVYTFGIPVWSGDVVHNQSYREENRCF